MAKRRSEEMLSAFCARWRGVLLFLLLSGLCACGLLQSGPGDTVKRFFRAMDGGRIEDAIQTLDPGLRQNLGDEKVRTVLAAQAEEMRRKHGGIASVQVEREEIRGDLATVQVLIRFKDGSEKRDTEKLVRRDGRWRITMSK
jgi:hypothetical protein